MTSHRRALVVAAVAVERDAVTAAGPCCEERVLPGGLVLHRLRAGGAVLDVLAGGVGPAAAAASTATALTAAALAGEPYDLVLSTGIAGGFAPAAPLGTVVAAETIVAADLGAQAADGSFVPLAELGFGTGSHVVPEDVVRTLADATGAVRGDVLTVSATTGTAARAAELADRHPRAVAEGMEGFGVAGAAAAHGVPAGELRTVSNAVGPRDRESWRIKEALGALTDAFGKLIPVLAERAEVAR
ncbi:futalosine hydrolase [Streptomyces sp. NPDC049555]|uniref:futalosine hydrolase n=1 Tax=Streptomyces sp. NPDC049555 TaxID=3154930 RepID=UPI003417A659